MTADPLRTTRQVADLLAELLATDDFSPWAAAQLARAGKAVRQVLEALEVEHGCETCGVTLPELSTGRPRRFCSNRCRQMHYRTQTVAKAGGSAHAQVNELLADLDVNA
jgi:hypothetical protein